MDLNSYPGNLDVRDFVTITFGTFKTIHDLFQLREVYTFVDTQKPDFVDDPALNSR